MFRKAKYIVLKEYKGIDFVPLIFPAYIAHDAFVRKLGLERTDVDSAGFVTVDALNKVWCSGRSDSLDLECNHPRDRELIMRMMYEE